MTRRAGRWTPLLALLAALAPAGCCSGGFDRIDSRGSLEFLGATLSDRTAEDARVTAGHVTGLPGAVAHEFTAAGHRFSELGHVYCGE